MRIRPDRREQHEYAGILRDQDAGVTTMELMVGMVIMVIFMAIFTGAVVSMATTINKVEAVTSSSAQINNAFLRLDKLVRYSDAITTIDNATGDWYVELDAIDSLTGTETCTQLRIDASTQPQQLQLRTWIATGTTSYTTLSPWTMLANNVTNGAAAPGSADQPFAVPAVLAGAATTFQRLAITLVAATAGAKSTSTTRSSVTFTALNSLAAATTNNDKCHQQLVGGLRP